MDYAVIIIGGGPSGLATALHLQQIAPHLTHRILLLEKEHYPRFKLCAGGLTLDAEILLERLGLDVNEAPHVFADKIHFDFASKGLNIRIPKQHALRIVRRDEFDNWLAKKAISKGIEIKEGVTIKRITPQTDQIIIETDQGIFRTQVLVGADGSNGITRRSVFPNESVNTARVLEVITPVMQNSNPSHETNNAYFEFSPIPENIAGYVWDFPTQINGTAMRCWGIYDTNILAGEKRPQLKEALASEMSRYGFDLNNYEIKGYPIRWFSPFSQFSAPRVILVGDAAGADGIFGEGISIALGYGKLAALAIREAFARGDFSFRHYRRQILLSPLGQALTIRTAITQGLYHLRWAWFQKFFWRGLKPLVASAALVFVLNWAKRMK